MPTDGTAAAQSDERKFRYFLVSTAALGKPLLTYIYMWCRDVKHKREQVGKLSSPLNQKAEVVKRGRELSALMHPLASA